MTSSFRKKAQLKNYLQHSILLLMVTFSHLNVQAIVDDEFVTEEDEKIIYQPEYFSRYAPQTANDMVQQIPGFTLAGNNQFNQNQTRGLGQGDGNFLINGKRVSSKDNGAVELLSRIPAENITVIEILTKGSTELAGQSGQIVNVVYQEAEETNGSWSLDVHTHERGATTTSVEASAAGKIDAISYSVSVNRYGNEFPQWGHERAYDENDELWEIRDENSSFSNDGLSLSLGFSWKGEQQQNANLNISTKNETTTFYEQSDQYAPPEQSTNLFGDFVSDVDFRSNQDISNYEIGADYSTPMASGIWKIIGLRRSGDNKRHNYFDDFPVTGDIYSFHSLAKPIEKETVLRTIFTYQPKDKHILEFALEGVKNTLETSSVYEEDTGTGFSEFEVEGSDVKVDEDRAELSVQYTRPVGDNWSLQSRLASEYSKLSVSGDGDPRSDSFIRYKGFVSLGGSLSKNSSVRTRLERSVGQLSFNDFASSRNVNQGTSNGGNTELVPEQSWRAEASYEHTFGRADIVTITGFVERIDDFITFMPFEDGTEARGNIDKLDRYGIDISSTIALDRFGIEGAKLDLLGEFHESTIIDPVTGDERPYRGNGHNPVHYKMSFRHDIPNTPIAYGVILEERSGNIRYRLDQVAVNEHRWPQAHILFFEHKDLAGMTLKVEVEDFFGFTWRNKRTFYDGDRNGDIIGRENSSRHSAWVARISLTANF